MDQTQPELLAPLGDLTAFAGRWVGGGSGHYPTIDDFAYDEEIELAPSGKPFLFYRSRTRKPGGGMPMHTETATCAGRRWRRTPGGAAHRFRGDPPCHPVRRGSRLRLARARRLPDAKPVHEIRRRFELLEGGTVLSYDMWMAFDAVPMTHHLRAELRRAD
ncbi:FABP family protein [Rhodococcus hoagii]|nr:FABP family protein [Prescottella equi]